MDRHIASQSEGHQGASALLSGAARLAPASGNDLSFSVQTGQVLARAGSRSLVATIRPDAAGGENLTQSRCATAGSVVEAERRRRRSDGPKPGAAIGRHIRRE